MTGYSELDSLPVSARPRSHTPPASRERASLACMDIHRRCVFVCLSLRHHAKWIGLRRREARRASSARPRYSYGVGSCDCSPPTEFRRLSAFLLRTWPLPRQSWPLPVRPRVLGCSLCSRHPCMPAQLRWARLVPSWEMRLRHWLCRPRLRTCTPLCMPCFVNPAL